jgi:hypothetical protein
VDEETIQTQLVEGGEGRVDVRDDVRIIFLVLLRMLMSMLPPPF